MLCGYLVPSHYFSDLICSSRSTHSCLLLNLLIFQAPLKDLCPCCSLCLEGASPWLTPFKSFKYLLRCPSLRESSLAPLAKTEAHPTLPFPSLSSSRTHALEKEMATHSNILAWRIPGMEEPDGLPSTGSHRVRHDWWGLAAAAHMYI